MKQNYFKSTILTILFFGWSALTLLYAQTSTVVFQADFNTANIEDPGTVGIRGSVAPLSWFETMPMEDPDGDGIYTLEVEFENIKQGDELLYKYVHDSLVWENDFGPISNRSVYLYDCDLTLDISIWNTLEKYAATSLLNEANIGSFWNWIYIIGNEKNKGLTAEKIGQQYAEFWGPLEWLDSPLILMDMEKTEQAKYTDGYFELIESTPNRLVYRAKKLWLYYFGEEGLIMNVSSEDMTTVFKTSSETLAKAKGWKINWEDEGGNFKVTIETE